MRKLCKLLLIALISISLVGCHGNKKSESSFVVPEEFDESKNYTISFWAKSDSNVRQVNVYKETIERFEELYPNIKVELKMYSDYKRIYNDVITNISTNTTPNVCITYPDHIATYITGDNVVANLDELIVDEKYGLGGSAIKFDGPRKDEVINEFLNEGIIGGKYYALPYMRSSEALYINEDLLNKLGYEVPDIVSWDFIYKVSDEATKKGSDGNYLINNQKTMIPFIYKSTDNMTISMLKQLNADYSSEAGEILIFNDETRNILKELSKHAKNGAFSTFAISSYPANYLNAGQCIFAIDSTAGATWMGSEAPLVDIPEEKIVKFKTVVRPIPQYDENNIKMISQGPSVCVFSKQDSQEVLASWLFAQFLLTNDTQISYAKTEGYIPVTTKAQNDSTYQEYLNNSGIDNDEHYSIKIDATKLVIDNVKNTFTTPVFNGSASLRTAAGQLIEETCRAIRKKATVDDEFIDTLFDDMNKLYRLDQNRALGDIDMHFSSLPLASKALIYSLVSIWVLLGAIAIINKVKSKIK